MPNNGRPKGQRISRYQRETPRAQDFGYFHDVAAALGLAAWVINLKIKPKSCRHAYPKFQR